MKIKKIFGKIVALVLSATALASSMPAYAEPTSKLDIIGTPLTNASDAEAAVTSLTESPEYHDLVKKFFEEEKERFENKIGEGHFKFNCDPFEFCTSSRPSKPTLDLALIYAIYLSNINRFFENFPSIKNEFIKIVTTTTDSKSFIISNELYDSWKPCVIQFPTDNPPVSTAKKRHTYLGRQNCILFINEDYFLEDVDGSKVLSELIRHRIRGAFADRRAEESNTIYKIVGEDAARIIGEIIKYTYAFNKFSNSYPVIVKGISEGMPAAIKTFTEFEKETSKQLFREILGNMPAADDGAVYSGLLINMPNLKRAEGISNIYSSGWFSNVFTHFWCYTRPDDWDDATEWSTAKEWVKTIDSNLFDWLCELDEKLSKGTIDKLPEISVDKLQESVIDKLQGSTTDELHDQLKGNVSLCKALPTSFDC